MVGVPGTLAGLFRDESTLRQARRRSINPIGPALYFDVTDIVEYAMTNVTVTGIERTVLRIVESVTRRNNGRPVFGLFKHPLDETYRLADLSFMREPYDLGDFASRFELLSGKSRWLAGKLRKYKGRPLKWLFHAARLHVQWAASPTRRAEILKLSEVTRPSCLMEARLAHGGVIVTIGAGWRTDYAGINDLARLHGCKVVSFVHDLIPILPSGQRAFPTRDKGDRFRKWIDYAAKESSLLICNSSFTKGELKTYLRENSLSTKVVVVRFPHEFRYSSDRQQHAIRSEVSRLMQSKYALCVGTIDFRKNTLRLLQTWHEMQGARASDTPILVLCGRRGHGADDAYAFLRQTANAGGTVMIIGNPNDAELEMLYRHCQFTVFPSLFEGWGLPIGESLWFGKPVLCANNASMPEVGGKFATYFDHAQPGSLLTALRGMLDHPAAIPENIRDQLTTWDDTAASLCRVIDGYEVECLPSDDLRETAA